MGYPSRVVAQLGTVPGVLRSIAGIEPPRLQEAPPADPKRTKATIGVRPQENGINKAITMVALMPGIAPKTSPTIEPKNK
jgi:hypothetical protein